MASSLVKTRCPGSTDRRDPAVPRGAVAAFVRIRPTASFARGLIECPDGEVKPADVCHRRDSRKIQDSNKGQPSSWSFRLDGILQDMSQEDVYARVGQRVVQGALVGYNGTIMCFGQTGSGKTYTMTGSTQSYKQRGIIPRALQEVEKRTERSFSVHLSYLEIYNETFVDMLSPLQGSAHSPPSGIVVMEEPGRGVTFKGLSLHPVHSEEEALNLLFEEEMNCIIGSRAMNRNASRSHCIFTIYIESRSQILSDASYITSKLNLVDLAGSERLGKTGSEGQVFKESTYINKSLSFLEQVILALGDHRRDHVPFRQTKLTHALKDSLGGNCNTVLVANIYGEVAQMEETLSTLRFASRMMCIQSNPVINEHGDPALQIKKLQKEVQMLKEEMSIYNTLANRPSTTCESLSEAQLAEINSQVRRYLDGSLNEISITSIAQVHAVFAQFKLAVQDEKQRVKAQQCQTYKLLEKDQIVKFSVVQECDTRDPCQALSLKERHGPSSTKPMKCRDKQSRNTRREDGSPVLMKQSESTSQPTLTSVQMPQSEQESKDPDTQETQKPGSEPLYLELPPTKAEVFEAFKLSQGNKINCTLKENKAVLLERRSLLRQLTEEVNTVKREIDCTATAIQQHKEMQETQDQYLVKEGEPEANLLLQLKELKALYWQRYEALRSIKAEVNYYQHLVDQCRVRLLSEFETWYKNTFLLSGGKLKITMDQSLAQNRQLENEPYDCSGAQSFHSAWCRTLRRRNIKLLSFTPVRRNQSA